MIKFIAISLITIALIGCSKENQKQELASVIGDYEWYYSFDGYQESIYNSDSEDKYGIRLKSRGKVQFFKNSEKEMALKILSCSDLLNGGKSITVELSEEVQLQLRIENNILKLGTWPFDGYENEFSKLN
jgi:hypothetical protein